MTHQDIDGKVPPETAAGPPGAPNGAPETLEQQLEKEREARVLMRERLRTTEALAAESHALRARMAEELERVTADRDRLRSDAAAGPAIPTMAGPGAGPATSASRAGEPSFASTMAPPRAPHAADRPLKPPVSARRKGPWGALAMLSVVAVAVAAVAWYKGSLPVGKEWRFATMTAPAATPLATSDGEAAPSTPPAFSAAPAPAPMAVAKAKPSTGAVALPPLTPEAQLAATPPAAGPVAATAAVPAPGTSPAEMSARLRKALDGEGIASPVDVDAASGHVQVTDPRADDAQRQRTEMVIRAVYAGASLPEPQIEHRWLSPMRGGRETTAATGAPAAAHVPLPDTTPTARHAALARTPEPRKAMEVSVANAEELMPVLPAGRVTASCMDGLAGKSAARRSNLTACMKHSCCSSAANHNSEECRAYERAFPFTCGAG